ncbi:SLAC1 anion channel family protein [Microbacter margulisiae]|uniref:Tellurite resistance protein n=1 Tax=Microbacter margulisiae TaxID=1350067 RepID=A0A7W5DQK3_9PORP|nr:SLAC1 anion channel family protein [Microbacter margulisiae]MBB3187166.1 tellurite resistance protein [Microbacter margulisiae]
MKQKLQFFPVTIFSMVMGMTGLSILIGKFYHLQWLPYILYPISIYVASALFLTFLLLYGLKWIYYPAEVKNDFHHRIRINFFSAISISLLLISIDYYSFMPLLAVPLWWIGMLLHSFLLLKTIRFWIEHNFELQHFNPAWFIPVVGVILIPICGVDIAPPFLSYFYFSIGFFFWIILFVLFLYRAVFHVQLPEKFIPTFFILIAPPAVGFVSYMRITTSFDNFSLFLLFIGYFFLILLAFMVKNFMKLRFFVSWWAFTFPLSAISIASVAAYQITHMPFFEIISWILFFVTVATIGIVAWQTIVNMRIERICVEEE